ncbi:hypothetical protein AB0D34_12235 [Streptomyces sp. NPDC048420]
MSYNGYLPRGGGAGPWIYGYPVVEANEIEEMLELAENARMICEFIV